MIPEYEDIDNNNGITIGEEMIVDTTKPETISVVEPMISDINNNSASFYIRDGCLYMMWKNNNGECFVELIKELSSTRPIDPKE